MEQKKIVFATNNQHKLAELQAIVGDRFAILSLSDIDCHEDIPETADTIEGNAIMKARYVAEKYGVDCFADDTGLEVEVLGGAPGVYTARYASMVNPDMESHDSHANVVTLLEQMHGKSNRQAQFVTVFALMLGGKLTTFEGICRGMITAEQRGENGFGYDPVFIPEKGGGELTFAELPPEVKNRISHRALATFSLIDFLKNIE